MYYISSLEKPPLYLYSCMLYLAIVLFMIIFLPYPSLVGESPMLKDHPLGFSNATWKDTERAHVGGVIFNTP